MWVKGCNPPSDTFWISPGQSVFGALAGVCGASELMKVQVCDLGFCGVSEGWTLTIPSIEKSRRNPWSAACFWLRGVVVQMDCKCRRVVRRSATRLVAVCRDLVRVDSAVRRRDYRALHRARSVVARSVCACVILCHCYVVSCWIRLAIDSTVGCPAATSITRS